MKKKDNYVLLIIVVVILLSILGIINFSGKDNTKAENDYKNNIQYKLLNDYSRFFTVNSCVYKYITYLSSNKTEDLLKLLNSEYISTNNINSSNIYNFINKLNGNYSFKSMKIYYEEINKNYVRYYVYGYLIQESLDGIGEKEDYYVIVDMDLKNQLFNVTPYD